MSKPASSCSLPPRANSSVKVVTITIASNAWSAACVTVPKGLTNWRPNAHNDRGISIKKIEVMTREMCERTSSHSGVDSPGEGQSGVRKV